MEVKLRCLEIKCSKCCENTEMQLSKHDIKRIEKLGYKKEEFSVEKDGIRILRNINGKCFFLKNGKCKIYDSRPLGCKLYPIVYDVEKKAAVVDDFCPIAKEISLKKIKRVERVLFKHISEIYGFLP